MNITSKIISASVICFMSVFLVKAQDKTTPVLDTMTIYRKKIDALDKQIIHLLGERMQAAKVIGTYKINHKVDVVQPARFSKVVEQAIAEGRKEGLSATFVRKLYEDVHTESVRQEEELKQTQ